MARAACRSGGARLGAVGLVDGWHQRAGRCPQRNQTPLGQKADLVDQHPVPRVGHQQHERIVACDQGQHRFALGHRAGDEGQGRRFGRDVARVHGVFAQPRGNHAAQLVLRERAAVHQDLPDGPLHALAALALLRLQAILQRGNRQQARMRHGLTQVPRLAHGGVGRGKLLPQRVRTLRARTVGGCCGRVLWAGAGAGAEVAASVMGRADSQAQFVIHRDGCVVRELFALVNVFSARQRRDRRGGQVVHTTTKNPR